MVIKIYYTSVAGSREVKSQQEELLRFVESKNIDHELIDVSVDERVRDRMRAKAGNPRAVPPQLFNGEKYLGSYDKFSEAVEEDRVMQFLKLA